MPIFPRRQLQLMLDELGPWLSRPNATDLLKRIDNIDPDQSIPGEYELGIGWALAKLTELKVGPVYGRCKPDFLTCNLFPDKPAVVEVTALSDDALSGKASMDRTADIISQYANTLKRRIERNLRYTFSATSGYRKVKLPVPIGPWTHRSKYYRRRLTSTNFELTTAHRRQLQEWLQDWPPKASLRIMGEGTVVDVMWQEQTVHPMLRTFSSMPSEVHDEKDNPIYERLKVKEKKQLAAAPAGYLRCIILGDAGCRLLQYPNESVGIHDRVSGSKIVWEFLRNSTVDIVLILSPRRRNEHASWNRNNPRLWNMEVFDKEQRAPGYYATLESALQKLPAPYLHGGQARSWAQQKMLGPQARGQYLPSTWGGHSVKISARAVLEMLAGRMNKEEFKHWITGEQNPFEFKLAQGYSISEIRFEPQGASSDDDYIEFKFALDPNAAPLHLPPLLMDGGPDESEGKKTTGKE